MPKSSVSMAEYDGIYEFDIDSYLISAYPQMTKPVRRAICQGARAAIDASIIEEMIDEYVREYALDQQGWAPGDDTDDE